MDSYNIVFLGSSSFVLPILQDIIYENDTSLSAIASKQFNLLNHEDKKSLNLPENCFQHECLNKKVILKLIITQPDKFLRQKIIPNPVSSFAQANDLELFAPNNLNQDYKLSKILTEGFDVGIVASFGQIISQVILDKAKYGFVNWHPSKLPLYRGATPMQTAIADGQTNTALSWIEMTKEMDAGNIWLQIEKKINSTEIFKDLAIKMGNLGSQTWSLVLALKLLSQFYPDIKANLQDQKKISFCQKIHKEDAFIDINSLSVESIYDHWRAYHLFPGTKFEDKYFQQPIKLAKLNGFFGFTEFNSILSNPDNQIISQTDNWTQIKIGKNVITFLVNNTGAIEVEQIILENGKNINFRGYQFVNQ